MTVDLKKRSKKMNDKSIILIIEDEPDILTYFEAFFQDNGYQTMSAGDGETGLKLARSYKPDLVTLDITMPGQSGMNPYRQFKSDSDLSAVPIVIITATIDDPENFNIQMKEFPAPDGFVTKPVNTGVLLKIISNILIES